MGMENLRIFHRESKLSRDATKIAPKKFGLFQKIFIVG